LSLSIKKDSLVKETVEFFMMRTLFLWLNARSLERKITRWEMRGQFLSKKQWAKRQSEKENYG